MYMYIHTVMCAATCIHHDVYICDATCALLRLCCMYMYTSVLRAATCIHHDVYICAVRRYMCHAAAIMANVAFDVYICDMCRYTYTP